MEFFGELLAELRKDKKLSQKELADIFHLAASTISSYEMGVHSPHVDQLAKFADYFNVSTDYLLGEHHLIYHRKFWKRHLWTTSKLAA